MRGNINLIHQHNGAASRGVMCKAEVVALYLFEVLLKLAVCEDFSWGRVTHRMVNGVQQLLVQRLQLETDIK